MNKNLPALTDGSLSDYLNEIKKFPMLTSEEEFMLAKAWVDHDDRKSAHRLVTSHLRLAAKIALVTEDMGFQLTKSCQKLM
jgi:RNA polymerase sigma-32 factor